MSDIGVQTDQDDGGPHPTVSGPVSPSVLEARLPPATGRYRFLDEIARGGMGVVYRAADTVLAREVAVKVLDDRFNADSAAGRRFVDEARVTGQLQHPGIPAVHDLGTFPDGRPFLAMKLVRGCTLDQHLKDRPDPAHDRGRFLAIFEQVCQAVGFAHDHRVLHRDLKPANIMVGGFGEVQVMDWGLAKVLTARDQVPASLPHLEATVGTEIRTMRDSDGSCTQAGTMLGTPAFMPPEQAGGEIDRVDERADVFGLGAILAVILTGRPPYVGKDGEAVRLMAVRGQLSDCLARLDECDAEPGLVALAKRCLAFDLAGRPRNAEVVAREVAALRAEAEQRARAAELEQTKAEAEAREQRKRRRVQLALAVAVGLLLAAGGAFAWWNDRQEEGKRLADERSVNQAVEDARARFERANGAGRDLALWAEARAAALQAEARAEEANAPPEVRERVRRLLGEIGQVEKNRRLILTLLEIHAGMGDTLTAAGDQDFAGANARYAQAFREHGNDLLAVSPEEAADFLRDLSDAAVRVQLAAAIDDWAYVRFVLAKLAPESGPSNLDVARRLFRVTRLLDPDPLRNQIRDTVAAQDAATLNRLAAEINAAAQPVQTINLVCVYLYWFQIGEGHKAAARFSLKAQPHHPGDFQINANLVFYLMQDGLALQAIPYAAAAVAVRPQSAAAWNAYGWALSSMGRVDEAIVAYRRVSQFAPKGTAIRRKLIDFLTRTGDREGAKAVSGELVQIYREEVRLNPENAVAHQNLASALFSLDDLEGAIEEYRKAVGITAKTYRCQEPTAPAPPPPAARIIEVAFKRYQFQESLCDALIAKGTRLGKTREDAALAAIEEMTRFDPKDAWPHCCLGNNRLRKGDSTGAVAAFRKAIQTDPMYVFAQLRLGNALRGVGKEDQDAVFESIERARLDPKEVWPSCCMGNILCGMGNLDGAAAAFRNAIQLNPGYDYAHLRLGEVLRDKGDLDGAVAAFRKGISVNRQYHYGHQLLGLALRAKGELDEAVAAFREVIRIKPNDTFALNTLHQMERWQELRRRLQEIASGRAEPASPAEALELARLGTNPFQQYALSARLYEKGFALDPKLIAEQGYNAARCAILAVAGKGKDADTLSAADRAALRTRALSWLRANLSLLQQRGASSRPVERQQTVATLTNWLRDVDLNEVRPGAQRKNWTKEELAAWDHFWGEVGTTRNEAAKQGPPPGR